METRPRLWLPDEPLCLASTSATRRVLLEATGIPVATQAPQVDERAVEAAMRAADPSIDGAGLASALAKAKALAVSGVRRDSLVVGADQTLALGAELLHKPASRADAAAQIARMAGRTHILVSAVAIAREGALVATFSEAARLTMRPLAPEAIDRYLDLAGESALASVGGYQLEGLGAHLFEEVEGDHTTILGLPVRPLLAALRRLGALAL